MGTTAEKLKYLNETKAEIKNALETPYNVMRDYPELIKKYIDNQPTKVVTDGICGNAVDVPVKTIETNGNIRQETTEGYQLLNLQSGMQNGITYYVDDEGYFYISGTCTSDRITLNLNEMVLNGTYTFTNKSISGGGINCVLKDNTPEYGNIFTKNNETKEVNTILKELVCYLTNGATYNSKIKLMLVSGSQEKDVEPYTGGIPSPNPDYPQEITNVGGYDNLFDKNNIISGSYVSDGNGAFVSDSTSKRTDYIEIQANSYYYIYSDKTSGNWGAWYDKDKKFISGITLGGQKEGTVNSPANAKYIAFTVSYQGNLTDYSNIKINETAIKIKQSGKNKLDFKKILKNANVTYTEQDGVFNLANNGNLYSVPYKLNLKPNTTYTIYQNFQEQNSTNVRLTIARGSNYEKVVESYSTSETESYRKKTFTTDESSDYYIRGDWSLLYFPLIYNEPILVEGTDDVSYEPYHESIITPINLQGNILSKVGDVKDILKVNRNGEVEIKKNIGKVVLDGSNDEKYLIATSNKFILDKNCDKGKLFKDIKNDNTKITAISNKLTGIPWDTMNDLRQGWYISIRQDGPFSYLRLLTTDIETGEDLKLFFQEHPAEVYYELATPQIITLPSISPIELWQGTNIFSLVTNLDTDFEVEYVVDKDSVTKGEE